MNKILTASVGVLGSAAALLTFGGGIASADDVVGQKYGEAKAVLNQQGKTTTVASTIGGRKSLNDCIVTGVHAAPEVDGYGKQRAGTMLVNLDCGGK